MSQVLTPDSVASLLAAVHQHLSAAQAARHKQLALGPMQVYAYGHPLYWLHSCSMQLLHGGPGTFFETFKPSIVSQALLQLLGPKRSCHPATFRYAVQIVLQGMDSQ